MEKIRNWMVAAGLAIIVVGLAWVGHGTGIIQLPATGFMSELSVWTINGSLVVAFGLIVLIGSWKLLRDEPHGPGFGDDHFLGES
ncbi:hypothetical protein [Pseudorhizobium flavum]|uniref:Uncharacterized protein n=1 Tax=Pseudorhizobium flavum TaxID=1335061 RepID=A0A7W9Z0C7_9HYPH|nr:hypothetical protein [Pseudorhizobium flavum]MBB6180826.1 hypothetical protein [Pseudorhizobium flavum]CAD6602444.1 hypothetical protein RFYW14_01127 [Pseudorhizobium flavum]